MSEYITPILSGALMDITWLDPVLFIYSARLYGLAFIQMYFVKPVNCASMFKKAQKRRIFANTTIERWP